MNIETCHEHSGCIADILTLKSETDKQWEALDKVNGRVDKMLTRVNMILAGIVVSVVLLAINLAVK